MGAPKKPMALRELHGTAHRNKQRNNDDAPIPVRGIGQPPAHLTQAEREIWDEIVGIMYTGVLGEADRIALEVITKLLYRFRFGGDEDSCVKELNSADLTRLCAMLSHFGMTPADRTKIVIPKQSKRNTFEML